MTPEEVQPENVGTIINGRVQVNPEAIQKLEEPQEQPEELEQPDQRDEQIEELETLLTNSLTEKDAEIQQLQELLKSKDELVKQHAITNKDITSAKDKDLVTLQKKLDNKDKEFTKLFKQVKDALHA